MRRSNRNRLRTSRRYLIGKRTEARAAALSASFAEPDLGNNHWYVHRDRAPVLISNSTGKPF